MEYLRNNQDLWKHYDNVNFTRLAIDNQLLRPITIDEIRTTIQNTGKRKAPGNSKNNEETIINLPLNMITNMKYIFNASLSSGYFPNKCKKAIIKFIPKADKDNTNVLNYRPVSLLETVGKVYEKIIDKRLRQYMETNEFI